MGQSKAQLIPASSSTSRPVWPWTSVLASLCLLLQSPQPPAVPEAARGTRQIRGCLDHLMPESEFGVNGALTLQVDTVWPLALQLSETP